MQDTEDDERECGDITDTELYKNLTRKAKMLTLTER